MTEVPVQLRIMQRLTEILERVNPADIILLNSLGEPYDLRGKVFRGRLVFGDNDDGAVVTIVEAPKPEPWDAADLTESTGLVSWLLLVQGREAAAADSDAVEESNPTDGAYYLKAAVEKQLSRIVQMDENARRPRYPDDYLLGEKLISGLSISPGVVRGPDGEKVGQAFFYIPLLVKYAIELKQPYVTV